MVCVELYDFLCLPLLVWQRTTKDRVKVQGGVELCHFLCLPLLVCQRTVKDSVKLQGCVKLPFPLSFITGVRKQWWTVWVLRSIWNLGPFILSPVSDHLLNTVELRDIWNFVISSGCLYWSHEEQCGTVWALKSGWHLGHVCPTSIASAPVQNCVPWRMTRGCVNVESCVELWFISFHFISFVTHHFSKPTELYLSSNELFDWLGSWMANMDIYINCFLLSFIAGHSKRSTQQCGYWRM